MSDEIRPFTIAIPDEDLADLRERLARTRWPTQIGGPWEYGTNLDYLRDLAAYWRDGFDWRRRERELNALPQITTTIDDLVTHAVHVRSTNPRATPLLFLHGWPGSFVEVEGLVPRLTDAFHIVAPSLPGYGFSEAPRRPGTGVREIADRFAELMTRLGYERFAVQGGDWGAAVTFELMRRHPRRLVGAHVNFVMKAYLPPLDTSDPEEQAFEEELRVWNADGTGYAHLQGTRPDALLGLTDSPAGLLAYIVEKFHAWTDHDGDLETALTRDVVLTDVAIYWLTRTIAPSIRLYRERTTAPPDPWNGVLPVPLGVAAFPREIVHAPERLLARGYDLRRYTRFAKGGHFAALERPDDLAGDIRAFFTELA